MSRTRYQTMKRGGTDDPDLVDLVGGNRSIQPLDALMAVIAWISENVEYFIMAYMGYRINELSKQSNIHDRQITLIGHHVHRMER